MKVINTNEAPSAVGPYSQAIEMGGLVFISGQLPINPCNNELEQNVKLATRQSIENIQAILRKHNLSLNNVGKTTIYLRDINDFAEVNEVYAEYFKEPFPARACYAVKTLPKGAVIEIEAVAEIK